MPKAGERGCLQVADTSNVACNGGYTARNLTQEHLQEILQAAGPRFRYIAPKALLNMFVLLHWAVA